FQCNGALKGAKLYHKAPLMIAKEVVEVLQEKEIFLAVEAVGCGFINMTLTEMYLMEWADRVNMDENLGIPQTDVPETILLDYGGPNVAKPLHIGHLRSAIIGESLKRLVKATGRTAISDVHLGDWGLQMGLVIAELQERNPEWKCFEDDFDAACDRIPALTADRLNEIYPFASKKSKEDSDFKRKAQTITARLQKGQAGYLALWKEIIRVSVGDMKKSYQKLNVDFDFWYGESDSEKYVDELIDRLKDQKLLYKSEGALVVDVAEESDKAEIPPIIIKKTDHSNIYATTDLATIIQREKDFSPNQLWYVVDSRQSLHFTQVFRCAKKAGLVPPTTSLEHLGFGTMNGSDGKPYKTRDGGVMPLSELFEKVLDTAYERVKSSDYSDDEAKPEVAKKIAVAAIKFGDLINHRSKDYIFDMDKFLA
ncbi:MAG: arginine--tRNA ligase, partial [Oscillospiraceae bacterium]